jgi:hypothetical protein
MRIAIQTEILGSIWHVVQVCIFEKRGREKLSAGAMLYKYLSMEARWEPVSDQGQTTRRALLGAVSCRVRKGQVL